PRGLRCTSHLEVVERLLGGDAEREAVGAAGAERPRRQVLAQDARGRNLAATARRLPRDVLPCNRVVGSLDGDDVRLQVDVLPSEREQFAAAQARVERGRPDGTV